ncbi:MAG: hypothetical protein QME05_02725 [Candidatus Margulisbacteria bacterium]|nr:hypothetical protein [Candidatus Margulisiibacteriota bacterium]
MVLTGREKATIFLSILGAETAGRILRYLPNEVADLIAAGVNHLPSPSPEALSEVLSEFKSFFALPESSRPPVLGARPRPAAPRKSYSILMYERPQMIAYLLSIMGEEERYDALAGMTRDKTIIEELIASLKTNSLSPLISEKLKSLFAERLFK